MTHIWPTRFLALVFLLVSWGFAFGDGPGLAEQMVLDDYPDPLTRDQIADLRHIWDSFVEGSLTDDDPVLLSLVAAGIADPVDAADDLFGDETDTRRDRETLDAPRVGHGMERCYEAFDINYLPFHDYGDLGFSNDKGEPPSHDVWYRLKAKVAGYYSFDCCGSNYGTRMTIRPGCWQDPWRDSDNEPMCGNDASLQNLWLNACEEVWIEIGARHRQLFEMRGHRYHFHVTGPSWPERECGPMDLVFVLDRSHSMNNNGFGILRQAMIHAINRANAKTAGDLRVGFVTTYDLYEPPGNDCNNLCDVHTVNQLQQGNYASVIASIAGQSTVGLVPNWRSPPWDQAIKEILTQDGCTDGSQWIPIDGFRPDASKIIILITDSYPGGCNHRYCNMLVCMGDRDDDTVDDIGYSASELGIRICTINAGRNGGARGRILSKLADKTDGMYFESDDENYSIDSSIFSAIIDNCGGTSSIKIDEPVIPALACDWRNGVIMPSSFDIEVPIHNSGYNDCWVTLSATSLGGPGGTATLTPLLGGPHLLPTLSSLSLPVHVELTPLLAGGCIYHNISVASGGNCLPVERNCLCIRVPECHECGIACPEFAIDEAEPCPPQISFNGGCHGNTVPFASEIECGNTVCGTLGGTADSGAFIPDEDWYHLPPSDTKFKVTIRAEFPMDVEVLRSWNGTCPSITSGPYGHWNVGSVCTDVAFYLLDCDDEAERYFVVRNMLPEQLPCPPAYQNGFYYTIVVECMDPCPSGQGIDQGDLVACSYPTLLMNPAHMLSDIAWLGDSVTADSGAPSMDDDNADDDGINYLGLPWRACAYRNIVVDIRTGSNYAAYAGGGGQLYLNGWCDGNIDGDFLDLLCDSTSTEWFVQDVPVVPGLDSITAFVPGLDSDVSSYNGIFRWRLTSQAIGYFGFGAEDTSDICPGLVFDSDSTGFAVDILGEVEDYILGNAMRPRVMLVANLTISRAPGGLIRLNWTSVDSGATYRVYESSSTLDGPWTWLAETNQTSHILSDPLSTRRYYHVTTYAAGNDSLFAPRGDQVRQ